MNEPETIEDKEAIILKCPDCGKMRDAIAFAQQLPTRLAPDGFVKCTCVEKYEPYQPQSGTGSLNKETFIQLFLSCLLMFGHMRLSLVCLSISIHLRMVRGIGFTLLRARHL